MLLTPGPEGLPDGYAVALIAIPSQQIPLQPQSGQNPSVLPRLQIFRPGHGSGIGAAV